MILTGICWGNPGKVEAGAVIVATHVASLNHQREDREGRIYRRTNLESSVTLPDWLCTQIATSKGHDVHQGFIGSAELHLSADTARNNLLAQHADLLGGEMEAFAFLPELCDVPWIVVKGVSDDAGDATDKAAQATAACRAAGVLPELIHALTTVGVLPTPAASPARNALVDAIIGDSIAVNRPIDVASVNDYLNDEIGPMLEQRLARYISDDHAQTGLLRALMQLLLEIIQNALRHGNASRATLTFYETQIELIDDGEAYEVTALTGNRGGALAWSSFKGSFLDTGMVKLSYQASPRRRGNHYGFKITALSEMLRTARAKCSVAIYSGPIGAPGGSQAVFGYDPTCEVLHVSTANIRMISRSLVIVNAITEEIEKGKTVYVACFDTDEMLLYERLLNDHLGPKLRIYVTGRAGI